MFGTLRILLVACLCLIAGFMAGWLSKPAPSALLNGHATGSADKSVPVSVSAERRPDNQAASAERPGEVYLRNRRETLAWMKRRNTYLSTMPFNPYGLDLSLALMLGLAPAEIEELNTAYQETKKNLDNLAVGAATGQVSADGRKLVVAVPSLTAGSAPLYTNLLETIKRVLGPDRYPLFNEIAGEGFDVLFDRFGLNPVTYELTLQPESKAGNPPSYLLNISSNDAVHRGGRTWSSNPTTREDLGKNFPAVAHFFTPDLGK